MNRYYADLHIHIGRTFTGKAVKITGAKTLTFSNIIETAKVRKGLQMIGIIDCHSPEVIVEMENLIESGTLIEHEEGGIIYGDVTIIPGSELEIYDEHCKGPIHVLCFFPTLAQMKSFSQWLSNYLKNIHLSSQRVYITGKELQRKVKGLSGLFIPAHVFTPFKSLYGRGVSKSLTEVFDPKLIDGIELGLSSNTEMADHLLELRQYTFLSNSDAHSLGKIAREYQMIEMERPTFVELKKALMQKGGRRIAANFGLDPLLGKYHRTVCAKCFTLLTNNEAICPSCNSTKIIKGVSERIKELTTAHSLLQDRPPYIHQIPLEFIPGLGPKMLDTLLAHFGTEMAVLHHVPYEALRKVVPRKIADFIVNARLGNLHLEAGGGGKYGKISNE
ncbi:TIGR00375 family protein [Bacillus aquiflavi]|uniref:TIGR00375 family protein n=1 Tax=Bacillus aquiflavi TaxID=2672567 RepID=A0A6B3W1Y0_9BACI|nr:endonuclease Q family protein [Bacillus aquiflavi]MBA4537287.1 TIGR00375 family protein [Bacillus aquiflavi]NEY81544.1 TIGR00375 family protein [Bacillus aquiflavi]UAC47145.1 endonuclease Q family protein [Bacillus aquiflavi]